MSVDKPAPSDRVFVPNGESRTQTAILLVGTAAEHGIDQRQIKARSGGFEIPVALADVIYADTKKRTAKKASASKTSGNRAVESNSSTDSDKGE